ncbi:hypothetical protein IQ07DRAFT_541596 [Pyrenochaeta sp. DS3sAY3a]|nr:hypothetical protein IQ07DRAFT_541596 [Pyrenochaeta sp. DS3sAY3a]
MPQSCLSQGRTRKVLKRSRYGCRNCKVRKLKCDEKRPQCQRCSSFGILCNFSPGIPDLQPIADSRMGLITQRLTRLQPPVSNAVWTSDHSTLDQMSTRCQNFISRYLDQNLITPNDSNMAHVNSKLLELTFTHPYLMHASFAVALAYDRYLNSSSAHRRLEECQHFFRSIALFNQRLDSPITPGDKDAIWGTAAALAMLAFASPDSSTTKSCWPLRRSEPSDLEWLRMNEGKMSLWNSIDPLRPDSIFQVMAATYSQMNAPIPEQGIDGVSRPLISLCRLNDLSTAKSNVYFSAVHAISEIQNIPDGNVTVAHAERFTRSIHGPFTTRLLEKDPIALLLLHLWYEKAGRSIWWIDLRAQVECPAICSYLALHHGKDETLQELLPPGYRVGIKA